MSAAAVAVLGDEGRRLAALARYRILDTTPEEAFDEVARLASTICATPIALVSLVDATRQWFKARVGLEAVETPRESSFCAHAIHGDDVFVVSDALADPRFAHNPLVLAEPDRFYAGAPLRSPEGFRLGTVCVIDRQPRELDEAGRMALRVLARQVMAQLELRRRMEESRKEIERLKKDFVALVTHELRTPLTAIRGSLGLLSAGVLGDFTPEARQAVEMAERNSVHLVTLINSILDFQTLERHELEQ